VVVKPPPIQFSLDLRPPSLSLGTRTPALWSPRDVWIHFNEFMVESFKEDRRVEYKIPTISLDELAKYFSMFSNTSEGGVIVIGVDKNYSAVGCNNVGQNKINEIEKLHLIRCPLAKPEFRRQAVTINGQQDFLNLVYLPYIGKLVETNKGDAFIRYGDSIHKMSADEKYDFRSSRHELSFEQESCGLKYPQDFDGNTINEYCAKYREAEHLDHLSDEEILELGQLGHRERSKFFPNNALALLAANSPVKIIPGCRARVQRFEGTTEGVGDSYNPLVDKFVNGNVVRIIKDVRDFIDSILYDFTWMNDQGKFITTKEYPYHAWFEALVNACVHRSYTFSGTDITIKLFADRLVIESPGGFCPPVNERNIYDVRASRNPILMNALYRLGFTRMAREGTRRMRDSMREWQLPEPTFEQEAVHGVLVRVTLQNNREFRKRVLDQDVVEYIGIERWRHLTDDERNLATYAFRNTTVNVSDAQRLIGRTWKTCKIVLNRMAEKGVLVFVSGRYERDAKAHYRLPDPGEKRAT
jgi:ATP-dependent DNA helicase RecG